MCWSQRASRNKLSYQVTSVILHIWVIPQCGSQCHVIIGKYETGGERKLRNDVCLMTGTGRTVLSSIGCLSSAEGFVVFPLWDANKTVPAKDHRGFMWTKCPSMSQSTPLEDGSTCTKPHLLHILCSAAVPQNFRRNLDYWDKQKHL